MSCLSTAGLDQHTTECVDNKSSIKSENPSADLHGAGIAQTLYMQTSAHVDLTLVYSLVSVLHTEKWRVVVQMVWLVHD